MTTLMEDAANQLGDAATKALQSGDLADLLYADDTLLFGINGSHVAEFAAAIERAGSSYGMILHWGKTQALSFHANVKLRRPDSSVIEERCSLEYLGALISDDGRAESEISRRIGFAFSDYRALAKLWSHCSVSRKAKVHYFESLVISKLVYGFSTLWLVTAQRRRLDGFYARCLRRI